MLKFKSRGCKLKIYIISINFDQSLFLFEIHNECVILSHLFIVLLGFALYIFRSKQNLLEFIFTLRNI